MKTGSSKFLLGLGLGSIVGILAYRFSQTPKYKQLKDKVCETLHHVGNHTDDMMEVAKEKVVDAGVKVADKVAEGANDVAEKADDVKNKTHAYANNLKR